MLGTLKQIMKFKNSTFTISSFHLVSRICWRIPPLKVRKEAPVTIILKGFKWMLQWEIIGGPKPDVFGIEVVYLIISVLGKP